MIGRHKRTYRILPVAARRAPQRGRSRVSAEERALTLFKRPRRVLIAEAAYYRALRRGFTDGDPLADWLAAEAEIDALLDAQEEPGDGAADESTPSTARNQT
jgi:hypothetical protein